MGSTAADFVDASGSASTIQAAIDSLSPSANKRIGSYVLGNKVRFYIYDVA